MNRLTKTVIGIFIFLLLNFKGIANDSLLFSKFQYPKVAYSIYQLETGKGTSKLYKKYNNMFGFKVNSRKLHIGKTKNGYAKYEDRNASLMDYYLFEKQLIKRFNIQNRKQYLSYIFKRYAKDLNYKTKLLKQLNYVDKNNKRN